MYYTQEQIDRANQADLVSFLQSQGEQLTFALALKNILGLVCDPVGGLVEVPCVKRNAFHAVHALVAVEMVGILHAAAIR